jgi:hypothetical protein
MSSKYAGKLNAHMGPAKHMKPKKKPATPACCNGVRGQGFILDQILIVVVNQVMVLSVMSWCVDLSTWGIVLPFIDKSWAN